MVEFQEIAPDTGGVSLNGRGGRSRVFAGGASQARRCELFTNAIGGERRDFTGYVANVAADPPLSIVHSGRYPLEPPREKLIGNLPNNKP